MVLSTTFTGHIISDSKRRDSLLSYSAQIARYCDASGFLLGEKMVGESNQTYSLKYSRTFFSTSGHQSLGMSIVKGAAGPAK